MNIISKKLPFFKVESYWVFLLVISLIGFTLLPVYTQDGPNHKKVAVILSRIETSTLESTVYQNNLSFMQPQSLFEGLYSGLVKNLHIPVSIDTFEKLFIILNLILICIAYRKFLDVWSPGRKDYWFLSLLLWFHPALHRGFYDFFFSIPFVLFALELYKDGNRKLLPLNIFLYAVVSWVAFLAHPFATLMILLVIGIDFLFEEPGFQMPNLSISKIITRKKEIIYFAIPLFFIAHFLIHHLFSSAIGNVHTKVQFLTTAAIWGITTYGNFSLFSFFSFFLAVPMTGVLFYLMLKSLKHQETSRPIFWTLAIGLSLCFPFSAWGGSYLSDRFLPYFILFIPLGLPVTQKAIKRLHLLTIIFFIGMCADYAAQAIRLSPKAAQYQNVLSQIPTGSSVYPIHFESQNVVHNVFPTHHFWALYDDQKVIFSPYLFTFRELFPLQLKKQITENYFPSTYDSYPSDLIKGDFCKISDPQETLNCNEVRKLGFNRIESAANFYEFWLVADAPQEFLLRLNTNASLNLVSEDGVVTLWKNKNAARLIP